MRPIENSQQVKIGTKKCSIRKLDTSLVEDNTILSREINWVHLYRKAIRVLFREKWRSSRWRMLRVWILWLTTICLAVMRRMQTIAIKIISIESQGRKRCWAVSRTISRMIGLIIKSQLLETSFIMMLRTKMVSHLLAQMSVMRKQAILLKWVMWEI